MISGTAAVVLAGLFGALRITDKKLHENTYLFVGAGQVCLYISNPFFYKIHRATIGCLRYR